MKNIDLHFPLFIIVHYMTYINKKVNDWGFASSKDITAFSIGIIIVVIGIFILNEKEEEKQNKINFIIGTVALSVGTSIMASSIYSFLSYKQKKEEDEIYENIYKEWGIIKIYPSKASLNPRTKKLLENYPKEIDISGIRLKGLLNDKENIYKLNKCLDNGSHIRILLPKEGGSGEKLVRMMIRNKNGDEFSGKLSSFVDEWQKDLSFNQRQKIEIRYSEKLISIMYNRYDNIIFMGQYVIGPDSSETFALECRSKGLLGKYLRNIFEYNFSHSIKKNKINPFVIEFIGMPGSGKTTCNSKIINEYDFFQYFTTEEIPCADDETPQTFNSKVVSCLKKKTRLLSHNYSYY